MQKTVLITGASSGFGHLSAEALAKAGHTVYAALRNTADRNAAVVGQMAAFLEGPRLGSTQPGDGRAVASSGRHGRGRRHGRKRPDRRADSQRRAQGIRAGRGLHDRALRTALRHQRGAPGGP